MDVDFKAKIVNQQRIKYEPRDHSILLLAIITVPEKDTAITVKDNAH